MTSGRVVVREFAFEDKGVVAASALELAEDIKTPSVAKLRKEIIPTEAMEPFSVDADWRG
jgi:hypothetical protein